MHIEFIGPPGSGKSTIFNVLSGIGEYPCINGFDDIHSEMPHLIGTIYKYLPTSVKKSLWMRYLKWDVFSKGICESPDVLSVLSDEFRDVDENLSNLIELSAELFSRYWLGTTQENNQRVFCIDEGFMMLAVSITIRKHDIIPPNESYYEWAPLPEILVRISTPREVCKEREQQRGRIETEQTWIQTQDIDPHFRYKKAIDDVCSVASEIGIKIIELDGTNDPWFNAQKINNQVGNITNY